MALVVVGARADDEHVAPVGRGHAAQRSDVAVEGGRGEPRHLGGGNRGDGLADEIGGLTPSAAEGDGDVVVFDARQPGDVGGGGAGDLERIGGEVERMRRISHADTISGGVEEWIA